MFRNNLSLILKILVILAVGGSKVGDNSYAIQKMEPYKGGCMVRDLAHMDDHIMCDQVDGLAYNGSECDVRGLAPDGGNLYETFTCLDGKWHQTQTGTDIGTIRVKRGFFGNVFQAITGPFVRLVTNIICIFGKCRKIRAPAINEAPYYESCPRDGAKFYAAADDDDVTIMWNEPVAKDKDGSIDSNKQTTTPLNGEKFAASVNGQPYVVRYGARDNHGASAHCDFMVYAYIHACGALQYSSSKGQTTGSYKCTRAFKLGSVCTYTCNTGHRLTDTATVTCQLNGDGKPGWTKQPKCEIISCVNDPTAPPNGQIACPAGVPHLYQSVCERNCNQGYKSDGSAAIRCLASGQWETNSFTCQDDVPPQLSCITPQVFYADRGVLNTSVNWDEPTKKDAVDSNPQLEKMEGPSQGDVLEEGSHFVKYQARDDAGNVSPTCTTELRVTAIPCEHPMDSMQDTYMKFTCSATSYYYGVTCQLSCEQKLPLNGSGVIACEKSSSNPTSGVWDWGTGTMPHCEVITCPALDPPANGALTMDSTNLRPVAVMYCQVGYDLPNAIEGFDGNIYCLDTGIWTPPMDEVPDCVVSTMPWLQLPSELYYTGACNSFEAQDQIKQQYIKRMEKITSTTWSNICKNITTCKTTNVRVVCGPSQTTKRRSTHELVRRDATNEVKIKWNFAVPFDKGVMTTNDAYMALSPILSDMAVEFRSMLIGGHMDIPGLTLKPESYKYKTAATLDCDGEGYQRDGDKCKPCPRGRQLDADSGKCKLCPLGSYKDDNSMPVCQKCDVGYSTKSLGAKSREACKRICDPGSYSLTGQTPYRLEPCSPCPVGKYQDLAGRDNCISCPQATTTANVKATSLDMCQSYDFDLSGPHITNFTSDVFTAVMESATISFWINTLTEETPDAYITINTNTGVNIGFNVTETILAQIESQMYDTGLPILLKQWTHVSLAWDTTTHRLQVFINGALVINEDNVVPVSTPIINGGSISFSLSGATGLYISGFTINNRPLSEAELSNQHHTCSYITSDVQVTMDIFKKINGANGPLMTPSTCDARDECADDPCNGHLCTNEVGRFSCYCFNGWTGKTCDIAPDHCVDNECEHASQCVNNAASYSCTCPPGYSGFFCEKTPVDGGWSYWTDWAGCDVTCGGGRQHRTRMCNNPVRTAYGANCTGDSIDRRSCNEDTCRFCGDRERTYGTIKTGCKDTVNGMTSCNYTCRPGMSFPRGVRSIFQYECGPSTDYAWSPVTEDMPECQRVHAAQNLGIITHVSYNGNIPDSQQDKLGTSIGSNINGIGCTEASRCTVTASVEAESRRKRDAGTTVSVHVGFDMTSSGDLNVDTYLHNKTVSPALQELIDTLMLMNTVVEQLQNNTNAVLDVEIDGVPYTVDPDSVSMVGSIQCPEGFSALDDVCVECPVGTRYQTGACTFCEMGTYQDQSAQSACNACPTGLTTAAIGANSIAKCSVPVPTASTAPAVTTTPTPADNSGVAAIVGGAACGTAAVLAIAFLFVFMWKKRSKTRARADRNGVRGSLNMVHRDRAAPNVLYANNYDGDYPQTTKTYRPITPGAISGTDVDLPESQSPPTYSLQDDSGVPPQM